tara:strand:- start:379 stop:855 length:477 start_codon:yes stop_codon:yes gene_type:complete
MKLTKERYGIAFPFNDSPSGFFLQTTGTPKEEIRANLIHLLLTKKGSRYFLPDFGTRLYEFVFEPLDNLTFEAIQSELSDVVAKYIPNVIINDFKIQSMGDPSVEEVNDETNVITSQIDDRIASVAGEGTEDYTAKITVEYTIKDNVFESSDVIVLNL